MGICTCLEPITLTDLCKEQSGKKDSRWRTNIKSANSKYQIANIKS
jgi:hypothetical protein